MKIQMKSKIKGRKLDNYIKKIFKKKAKKDFLKWKQKNKIFLDFKEGRKNRVHVPIKENWCDKVKKWITKQCWEKNRITPETDKILRFIVFSFWCELNFFKDFLIKISKIENFKYIPIFLFFLFIISPLYYTIFFISTAVWIYYYLVMFFILKILNNNYKINLMMKWNQKELKMKNFYIDCLYDFFIEIPSLHAFNYTYRITMLIYSKHKIPKTSFWIVIVLIIIFPFKFLLKLFTGFSFLVWKLSINMLYEIKDIQEKPEELERQNFMYKLEVAFVFLWFNYYHYYNDEVYLLRLWFVNNVQHNPFGKKFVNDFTDFLNEIKKLENLNKELFKPQMILQTKNSHKHYSLIMKINLNKKEDIYMCRTSNFVKVREKGIIEYKMIKNYPGIFKKDYDYTTYPHLNKYLSYDVFKLNRVELEKAENDYNIKLSFFRSLWANIHNPLPTLIGKRFYLENIDKNLIDVFKDNDGLPNSIKMQEFLRLNTQFFNLYGRTFNDFYCLELLQDILFDMTYDNDNQIYLCKNQTLHNLFENIK